MDFISKLLNKYIKNEIAEYFESIIDPSEKIEMIDQPEKGLLQFSNFTLQNIKFTDHKDIIQIEEASIKLLTLQFPIDGKPLQILISGLNILLTVNDKDIDIIEDKIKWILIIEREILKNGRDSLINTNFRLNLLFKLFEKIEVYSK